MRLSIWLTILVLLCNRGNADVSKASQQQNETAEDATQSLFDILDYQIEGNTVLDDEAMERAVYPFLGPNKSVDDVEKARAALESAYHKAGYLTVVVAIPEQDVVANAVRLEVTQGAVETLYISGSRYYDLGKIRAGIPALAEGQVPNMPEVQKQMDSLAEQSSDRSITPVFRAGSTPGKMEVELKVKDALPVHGNVEMNSRSSEHTSYSRLSASVSYDNLWQRFHSASLQYQVSPQESDEVAVWSGTYVLPTGWQDTRLAMYGIDISSNTQTGVSVGGLTVIGAGSIYGFRLSKPLISTNSFLQSMTAGFDYKHFSQQIQLSAKSQPISYASFMAGYDGSWRSDGNITNLNISGHFSVRGLGNDSEEFKSKRSNADGNFIYLTAELKNQYRLPLDFRLHTRVNGQASMSALIPNEQFSAGGPLSVRGYHQTQVLGDHGINFSTELYSPRLLPNGWSSVQNFRLLTFFDWAQLWTVAPIAPTPSRVAIASTGIGLRGQWFKHFLSELDWSYPLYKQNTVDIGQQRVDFRLLYEF